MPPDRREFTNHIHIASSGATNARRTADIDSAAFSNLPGGVQLLTDDISRETFARIALIGGLVPGEPAFA